MKESVIELCRRFVATLLLYTSRSKLLRLLDYVSSHRKLLLHCCVWLTPVGSNSYCVVTSVEP